MSDRTRVLWNVARDPQLRRLQVSFLGFAFSEHATWLAIIVYAYQRGGVSEAGLMAMVQLAPAALVAPFAAYAGDRFRAERVLTLGYTAQSISLGVTAVAMAAGQPLFAYSAAVVAASSFTFSRPIIGALLPMIAQTPKDLVAANVVTGLVQYVGMLLGPLVAGIVLSQSSPTVVFAICAAATANSALASLQLRLVGERRLVADARARDVFRAVGDGLRALNHDHALRSLVVLMSIGGLARGVADVMMVLFAEARLGGGGGEAGVLGVGAGIGAVGGSLLSAGLIGRARITPYLMASGLLFAVAFCALSRVNVLLVGAAMFVLFGVAESVLRITSSVGLQRLSPDEFRARIFGVDEGLQMASMAVGSLAVAVAVRAVGLESALLVIGSAVLLSMVWVTYRFWSLGGDVAPPPDELIDRLLADPVFEHLSSTELSRLAVTVEEQFLHQGATVIVQGERGDRYYLVVAGSVEVTLGGAFVRTMGAGQSFGEIALLKDVPRTATVTCATDVQLYAVSRDEFLETVTGHPRSLAAASRAADTFTGGATG